MPKKVNAAVFSFNLEISVIGAEPTVDDLSNLHPPGTHEKPARGFFSPVSGIAFDPQKQETIVGADGMTCGHNLSSPGENFTFPPLLR